MTDCKFKVGDRVSNMGRKGTVRTIDTHVHVEFDDGWFNYFLLDGRREEAHIRPSLKKLKKKKARYYWLNTQGAFYENGVGSPVDWDDLGCRWFKDCGTKKPKGA